MTAATNPPVVRKRLHIFHRLNAPATVGGVSQNWYWHATLGNGEIVAEGEGYRNKGDMVSTLAKLFDLDAEQAAALSARGLFYWTEPTSR